MLESEVPDWAQPVIVHCRPSGVCRPGAPDAHLFPCARHSLSLRGMGRQRARAVTPLSVVGEANSRQTTNPNTVSVCISVIRPPGISHNGGWTRSVKENVRYARSAIPDTPLASAQCAQQ